MKTGVLALTFLLLLGMTLPAPTKAADVPEVDLSLGTRGSDVVWLQKFLILKDTGDSAKALGRIGATGYFGPYTRAALAELQRTHAITPARGYFGAKTRAALTKGEIAAATFRGRISDIDLSCIPEGVCSVIVNGKKVIVSRSDADENISVVGTIRTIGSDTAETVDVLYGSHGTLVEVRAAKTNAGDFTLYGSSNYYIQMLDERPQSKYKTQELNEGCYSEGYMCDIALIYADGVQPERVLVKNLTELFSQQTGTDKEVVKIYDFYFPSDSDSLIFTTAIGSSACCQLYRFDVNAKKFSRLQNATIYAMRRDTPSPDNRRILSLGEDGTQLVVTDVVSDSVVTTFDAGKGKTFIETYGAYGGEYIGNYFWNDNDSFSAEIYDESQEAAIEVSRTRLEMKTFNVLAARGEQLR